MNYRIELRSGEKSFVIAPDSICMLPRDGLVGVHSVNSDGKWELKCDICSISPSKELLCRRELSAFADSAKTCEITVALDGVSRRITAVPSAEAIFTRDPVFGVTEVTLSFTSVLPFFEGTEWREAVFSSDEILSSERFSVSNDGDVPCGAVFTVRCMGEVVNPRITLVSETLSPFLEVTGTFAAGDVIVIDTRYGKKGVTVNDEENLSFAWESSFFALQNGENLLSVSAKNGKGNMTVAVEWLPLYYGV